jgi:hypothetical protein
MDCLERIIFALCALFRMLGIIAVVYDDAKGTVYLYT